MNDGRVPSTFSLTTCIQYSLAQQLRATTRPRSDLLGGSTGKRLHRSCATGAGQQWPNLVHITGTVKSDVYVHYYSSELRQTGLSSPELGKGRSCLGATRRRAPSVPALCIQGAAPTRIPPAVETHQGRPAASAENRCKGGGLLYDPGSWLPLDRLLLTDGGADAQYSFRWILGYLDPPVDLPETKPTQADNL